MSSIRYRAEIDGLRSVAVLPVILFHGGVTLLSGGFVGVDIFFVISGFLITGILARELEAGRFSVIGFYERRARRILPALFVVLAVTAVLAWLTMLPGDLRAFGKSVVATMAFVSNLWFWSQTGYFEPDTDLVPLLHTWSLAVEEQYYIFFPLFLWAVWRFGRRMLVALLIAISLVSLGVMEWGWRHEPTANFFWLPPRAWELLAGGLCAIAPIRMRPRAEGALAGLGLILVGASIFLIDEAMPWPSLWTVPPVLGTCLLLLYAGPGNLAGRLLAMKAPVAIGLISYSAYLWHQPLFAFARIYSITEPPLWAMMGLAALSLLLAWATWAFVEQPIRSKGGRFYPGKGMLFAGSGLGIAAFVALGLIFSGHGFPGRMAERMALIKAFGDNENPLRKACYYTVHGARNDIPALPDPDCVRPAGASHVDAILVGDSHSDAIAGKLIAKLNKAGLSAEQMSVAGCAPFPGYWYADRRCDIANAKLFDFLETSDIGTVVVMAKYSGFMYEKGFNNGIGGVERRRPQAVLFADPACTPQSTDKCRLDNSLDVIEAGIDRLLAMGKTVIFVYPVPEAGWEVRDTYAKLVMRTGQRELATPYAAFRARYAPFFERFDPMTRPRLIKVDPAKVLCNTLVANACINARGDTIYYNDNNHLADAGSDLVTDEIVQAYLHALARN